jgi:hypothetical protein
VKKVKLSKEVDGRSAGAVIPWTLAVLELLNQALFLNQILVWLLPYALAVLASLLFIKYWVKEI